MKLGSRTAENEQNTLGEYFVETESWRKVYEGEVDLILAPKGGGKTAIYSMLKRRQTELFDRRILLIDAGDPTEETALREFTKENSTLTLKEKEFEKIWELYFITLAARTVDEHQLQNDAAQQLKKELSDTGLYKPPNLPIWETIRDLYFDHLHPDRTTVKAKITKSIKVTAEKETTKRDAHEKHSLYTIPIDSLFRLGDAALRASGYQLWILLDGLDFAFDHSVELERTALRALFATYRNHLMRLSNISAKIFLRSDIWKSVSEGGFRGLSHFERDLTIGWNRSSLLQLAVQRILRSETLMSHYQADRDTILADAAKQERLFHQVYPEQITRGSKQLKTTFDWCLSRTKDGTGTNVPRELIHLLTETQSKQLKRFENGQAHLKDGAIYESQSFKDAMPQVSVVRLEKTIYPEYPKLTNWIESLKRAKSTQTLPTLCQIWQIEESECNAIVDELVEVGFFERRQDRGEVKYVVPFLYRHELKMIQGEAKIDA